MAPHGTWGGRREASKKVGNERAIRCKAGCASVLMALLRVVAPKELISEV